MGCQSNQDQNIPAPDFKTYIFLDSSAASKSIIQDDKEFFFELINALDMSIQLKTNFPDSTDRNSVLKEYKKGLQQEVLNFSEREKEFVKKAMSTIFNEAAYDLKTLLEMPVQLIKVSGKHYGDGIYYTRENCIIIPANELQEENSASFEKVIKHEWFHIFSRYHPEKRKALYELIGFKSIGNIRPIQMDKELRSRILLNPDGINYAYAIDLKGESGAFQAIPITISNKEHFDSLQPVFFHYLKFDLYKIQSFFSKLIKVESTASGKSLVNHYEYPDFREQIGDNTNYIIHPDEILADNFVLLLNGKSNWQSHSPRGREILKGMKSIIFE